VQHKVLATPADIVATIYALLGIPRIRSYADPLGRPISAPEPRQVLHEIIA